MEPINDAVRWFLTPEGRIVAAAILFALIWMIKNVPWIKDRVLTCDRSKLAATAILSLAPAAVMLTDQSVTAKEAWYNAFMVLLGAMGLQGMFKAAVGEQLKVKLKLGESKGKG